MEFRKIKDGTMENIKKPETVIGLINTAALLGVCVYFYRKTNNLELELNKHSENLTTTVKKVKETFIYKKHIATISDEIRKQSFNMGQLSQDINRLKEVAKIQAAQIAEMQTLFAELKAKNPELKEVKEAKLKDNAALRIGNLSNVATISNVPGNAPSYPQLPQPSPQFNSPADFYPQPSPVFQNNNQNNMGHNNNGQYSNPGQNMGYQRGNMAQPMQPMPSPQGNNGQSFPPPSPMNGSPDSLLDFPMSAQNMGGMGGFNQNMGNFNNGMGGMNGGFNGMGQNMGNFNNGMGQNMGQNMGGGFNNGMNPNMGNFNNGMNQNMGQNMNITGNMNDMESSEDDAINAVRMARQRNQENPFLS